MNGSQMNIPRVELIERMTIHNSVSVLKLMNKTFCYS